jgi:allantoin racemase
VTTPICLGEEEVAERLGGIRQSHESEDPEDTYGIHMPKAPAKGGNVKIKIIIPNASQEFLASQIEERRRAARHGVDLDVICLSNGPVSLESGVDEALIGLALLTEVRKAEREGYDAIVIDAATDPGGRAVRELVDVPVTTGLESALLYALSLGDKISVVTSLENSARLIKDRIRTYELQGRVVSIRFANVPVLDLGHPARTVKEILKEAHRAIDEDGADVIVLGNTGMSTVARILQEHLEVPVVDPAVAALTLATSLVQMGLSHSRRCYLAPPEKDVLGEAFQDWEF